MSAGTGDRIVAGCMTGTSIDALDIAVVRIHGRGLRLRAELVDHATAPLGGLVAPLRALAEQQPMTAGAIARLAQAFALLHVEALAPLHRQHRLDLISVHGQTVFHAPPVSWQLFQPAPLALALGVPVVCDLRAADLAVAGQGAPLTPLADHLLLRRRHEPRAVINLGGFCNVTLLPGDDHVDTVQGRDVCACNQVLDAVARAVLDAPYDRDGAAALAGSADRAASAALERTLTLQGRARRSLGTGDEAVAWVERWRGRVAPADLARSACAAVATAIARAVRGSKRLILAGGGVRNQALVAELRARADAAVALSDEHGVPAAYREAMAWAVLGALSQDDVPIALPQVTGAVRAVVAGTFTK